MATKNILTILDFTEIKRFYGNLTNTVERSSLKTQIQTLDARDLLVVYHCVTPTLSGLHNGSAPNYQTDICWHFVVIWENQYRM